MRFILILFLLYDRQLAKSVNLLGFVCFFLIHKKNRINDPAAVCIQEKQLSFKLVSMAHPWGFVRLG